MEKVLVTYGVIPFSYYLVPGYVCIALEISEGSYTTIACIVLV